LAGLEALQPVAPLVLVQWELESESAGPFRFSGRADWQPAVTQAGLRSSAQTTPSQWQRACPASSPTRSLCLASVPRPWASRVGVAQHARCTRLGPFDTWARVMPSRVMQVKSDVQYLWQRLGASEGTHRTLCLRQRSQAKAFPMRPSRASMAAAAERAEGGGSGSDAAALEGWWGSPIMPRTGSSEWSSALVSVVTSRTARRRSDFGQSDQSIAEARRRPAYEVVNR
jgi:hypothetical protein